MIHLYDTTLRDGTQMEGVSVSCEEKLEVARRLDQLGIHYIEGGWPGSNPKDAEFFERARSLTLRHARIAAFGSTRRARTRAEDDQNLRMLIAAETPVVTIFGKSSEYQVTRVLETSLEENLRMIAESIRYLKQHGRTVFYDAEHFFDGYKANPDYALMTLQVAAEAGADCVILCDTNGGSLPWEVGSIIDRVKAEVPVEIGIHAHNDGELAVANSLAAVAHGATHVQGTMNGIGERCGNANLCSVIPDLQLKLGHQVLAPEQLARLTETAHAIADLTHLDVPDNLPYVGTSAFAHKGGVHVAAVMKDDFAYQHIDPALVGNKKRVVVSELSGKGNILYKSQELGISALEQAEAITILGQIKALESRGFQFEGAEASFELIVRRHQADYVPPFELIDFMVVVERHRRSAPGEGTLAEAMVKVRLGDRVLHTAAEGNGPVNALDAALRKALSEVYPEVSAVTLVDYRVDLLDRGTGTGATTRVLIKSTDGEHTWTTVGSSPNIIESSWLALADSLEYWLLRREEWGASTGASVAAQG